MLSKLREHVKLAMTGLLLAGLSGCNYSKNKIPHGGPVVVQSTRESIQRDFVNAACVRCHTQETPKNRYVDLVDMMNLTVPGDHTTEAGHHHRVLIKPGCPKESLFLSILKEGKMPPPPSDPVSPATIQAIHSWIVSLKPDAGNSCNSDEPGVDGGGGDEPGPGGDEPGD